jgi:iron complex outermembrane receptor protein
MKSEHVIAYEAGYRAQPSNRVSVDVAAFFNSYNHLESLEPGPEFFEATPVPPILVHPIFLDNQLHGTTAGVEASVNWKVTHRWTLSPGYSFLEINLHTDPTSQDTISVEDAEGSNPEHQAQLRSHLEFPRGISWDANAYFVGALPAQLVPSYTRLDMQVSWRVAERVELSLVGQNLLKDRHEEFSDTVQSINSALIKRSAYAKFTWQF